MAIESPPCHLASPPHARLQTHAKGGHAQIQAPTQAPGVVAWAFSPNPRPNPSPIPHGLIHYWVIIWLFGLITIGLSFVFFLG
ncbi:hypothetical protein HanIR_Chr11g0560111 [Helianthus annuus]|nr:hypothetical protein HanIR_Chr11g0560111 [Helianthus annuus]